MKRDELQQSILRQFEKQWAGFLEKCRATRDALTEELQKLRETYGNTAVNFVVRRDHLTVAQFSFSISTDKPVDGKSTASPVTSPRPRRKRRRRRSRQINGAVSFSELKNHVLVVVTAFGKTDNQFTVQDVQKKLKRVGVRFDPRHLYNILPGAFRGIKVVGKKKREKGGGMPMNVYAVQGPVSLAD